MATVDELQRTAQALLGDPAARHSAQVAGRSRDQFAARAEVGPPAAVKNPRRKNACKKSAFKFLATYFPFTTGLRPFSDDHKRAISGMQADIIEGGRRVNAVYRGFAKTTISENLCLWATLYGYRSFVLLTAANDAAACGSIDSIKKELAENDLLAEDFPEVCQYIAALEGKPQRAPHQTCNGEPTGIVWKADTVVYPMIQGSAAAGAIIIAKPFRKARGIKFKRRDGRQVRPDLAINDDVQDDESARSPVQVRKNMDTLRRGILQSSGHGTRMTAIVNATVIAKNDLIDQLLRDPAWQGVRVPMVKRWADAHKTFWLGDYAELRRSFDRTAEGDQKRAHARATRLYRAHRREADAGCEISWKQIPLKPGELSAVQHAYNILIDDGPEVFASEYQNEPESDTKDASIGISREMLIAKLNHVDRGVVPKPCQLITAFIDVHDAILYWLVMGWEPDLTGYLVDYGTYPRQPVNYFVQSSPPISMPRPTAGANKEATILAGLNTCSQELLAREFLREDAARMRIGKLLVDAKYETETVKAFCRRSIHAGLILPAQGFYIRPESDWASYFARKEGGQTGFHWRIPPPQGGGERYVLTDTDWWKTLASERLAAALGDRGCWSVFGRSPAEHQLLCEHWCAEKPEWRQSGDRGKWHWELPSHRPDNHWWDGLIGSAVGASILGAQIPGTDAFRPRRSPGERPTLAQLAGRTR